MSGTINPDLGLPGSTMIAAVPPLSRVENQVQEIPELVADKDVVYYFCTVASGSFFTPGGTRITFKEGIYKAVVRHVIEYLDKEIEHGGVSTYLRRANAAEVRRYNMMMDPEATIRNEITPEVEAKIRAELEAKIREEITDAMKLAGIDPQPGEITRSNTATVQTLKGIATTANMPTGS